MSSSSRPGPAQLGVELGKRWAARDEIRVKGKARQGKEKWASLPRDVLFRPKHESGWLSRQANCRLGDRRLARLVLFLLFVPQPEENSGRLCGRLRQPARRRTKRRRQLLARRRATGKRDEYVSVLSCSLVDRTTRSLATIHCVSYRGARCRLSSRFPLVAMQPGRPPRRWSGMILLRTDLGRSPYAHSCTHMHAGVPGGDAMLDTNAAVELPLLLRCMTGSTHGKKDDQSDLVTGFKPTACTAP